MKNFQITFKFNKKIIPKDYHRFFLKIIKKSLKNYDNKFYKMLYKRGAKMKPYTFSVYLDIKGFEENNIILKNKKVKMFFSTDKGIFASKFALAFLEMKNQKFKFINNISAKLLSVEFKELIKTNKNSAIIQIASPLVVQSHSRNNDYFYLYDEKGFIEQLIKIINSQITKLGYKYKKDLDSFDLVPYKPKKTVVKFYEKSIAANRGKFIIQANSELINWLQLIGLGSKRSCGFGKFIILKY